jgi:hypothetical protein
MVGSRKKTKARGAKQALRPAARPKAAASHGVARRDCRVSRSLIQVVTCRTSSTFWLRPPGRVAAILDRDQYPINQHRLAYG